jgi:hypothetical protein
MRVDLRIRTVDGSTINQTLDKGGEIIVEGPARELLRVIEAGFGVYECEISDVRETVQH